MLKGLKLGIIELILLLASLLSTRTEVGSNREDNVRQCVVSLKTPILFSSILLLSILFHYVVIFRNQRTATTSLTAGFAACHQLKTPADVYLRNRSQLIATRSRVHWYLVLKRFSVKGWFHHTFICLSHSCLVNRISGGLAI